MNKFREMNVIFGQNKCVTGLYRPNNFNKVLNLVKYLLAGRFRKFTSIRAMKKFSVE